MKAKTDTRLYDAYDQLPNEENLTDKETLSAYLPWEKEVQEQCKSRIERRKAA